MRVDVPADIQVYAAYIRSRDARDRASAVVSEDNRSVLYELKSVLLGGQDFEVHVEFTLGEVAGAAQDWQLSLDAQIAAVEKRAVPQAHQRVMWYPISLIVLCGGLVLLFVYWHRFGRDKPAGMVAEYLTEPPDGVRPGMVTALMHETCVTNDIVATVVDLAERGVLRISQGKNNTTLTKLQHRDDLPPYEEAIMGGLSATAAGVAAAFPAVVSVADSEEGR